jgi:cyclopropane fatty-acyl-phospholipid synthase-like methyltransferase
MNLEDLRQIYDKVYGRIDRYNRPDYLKFSLDFAQKIGGTILDVGCGKGHHLRRLIKHDVDAFGIEFSPVCCERFLTDVPHECVDIVSFSERDEIYDGVICIGVMEHIPYENVDETLTAIAKLSKNALFAIANHSDILLKHELHIIQENMDWWARKLVQHYDSCLLVQEYRRLFILECTRNHSL